MKRGFKTAYLTTHDQQVPKFNKQGCKYFSLVFTDFLNVGIGRSFTLDVVTSSVNLCVPLVEAVP